jgi:hypothetical protein
MRRVLALSLLATVAVAAPSLAATAAPAPAPQVKDVAGDANGGANAVPTSDTATPVGSQAYADVVSVLWQTTKTSKKVKNKTVTTVTGFTVTATLSGPPTAPPGTTVVYRMLGSTAACPFFGVAYYTSKSSDPNLPQSAIRDNCVGGTTRLTPIALPAISGNTMKWTVPLSAIPANTKVKVGSKLAGLWFETREIEDFHGNCVPDDGGLTGLAGACGLGYGALDNSKVGDASYAIG